LRAVLWRIHSIARLQGQVRYPMGRSKLSNFRIKTLPPTDAKMGRTDHVSELTKGQSRYDLESYRIRGSYKHRVTEHSVGLCFSFICCFSSTNLTQQKPFGRSCRSGRQTRQEAPADGRSSELYLRRECPLKPKRNWDIYVLYGNFMFTAHSTGRNRVFAIFGSLKSVSRK
jgi:hypothetical protein